MLGDRWGAPGGPPADGHSLLRGGANSGLLINPASSAMSRSRVLLAALVVLLVTGPACAQPEPGGDLPFDTPLLPADEGEEHILTTLEEMRAGRGFANVSVRDGRVLRLLTEATNAQRVVEIGTSTGESAVWFALALRKTGGHLYTHEIDDERARIARRNFRRAGVDSLITLIEGDAHETVRRYEAPIDIVFLDADKPGYPDYLEKLLPLVRPGGLVIAHNMHRPEPDPRYVEAITQNPKLESVFLFMDAAGLGVTMKKR